MEKAFRKGCKFLLLLLLLDLDSFEMDSFLGPDCFPELAEVILVETVGLCRDGRFRLTMMPLVVISKGPNSVVVLMTFNLTLRFGLSDPPTRSTVSRGCWRMTLFRLSSNFKEVRQRLRDACAHFVLLGSVRMTTWIRRGHFGGLSRAVRRVYNSFVQP